MARLWLHNHDVGALGGARAGRSVNAAILVTTGSPGIAVLANFLFGPWQVASFATFVIVFVAGLVLAWTRRARTWRDEP